MSTNTINETVKSINYTVDDLLNKTFNTIHVVLPDWAKTLIKLILVIILVVVITKIIKPRQITYYVYDSTIDPTFAKDAKNIIAQSELTTKYNLLCVNDPRAADITIKLKKRQEMDKWHEEDKQYYPDGRQIRFSLTWQGKEHKPRIYIDDQNWLNGVKESGLTLEQYKEYVIIHELMHGLGFDHQPCNETTAVNGVCPIMTQSTRGCPKGFRCGYKPLPADYTLKLDNRYI